MKKKVTMSDIAAATGLSQSSVSLILSGKKNVSFAPETIAKVQAACQELGYQPPNTTMSHADSKLIMIMSENLTIPYYSSLAQQIENIALLNGYRSVICNTNRNEELELSYLNFAVRMNVSGIICLAYPHCPEKFNEISKTLPVIAVCDKTDNFSVDIVEMDNFQSSVLLIDHLVQLGHKKIMLLTASPDVNLGRHIRVKGLKHQMAQYGLKDSFFVRSKDVDWQSEMAGLVDDYSIGYELMQDPSIFKTGATAFIGMTDVIARGIADALIEQGKQIPKDYSICGYDNLLYARLLPLSLTTVDPHINQKGRSAFELLQRQISILNHNQNTHFQEARIKIEHPPVLVVRSSTGPAPTAK
ncbi:MAG: LacI family DNA-binding transcriptional regulator [Christensenella sp.]|uniref:LacI family DNA-binding transcriptional regulator n=1 Tax=Christensenella sp. TaxID=1935934 RepID=UPI002B2175B5|nr:LacI family DNA-binding transcriptional regulator [Christensenella sp.]MEA5003169.1 LacI family DNA-binding transcriptional regulator [Christensenella sp.]